MRPNTYSLLTTTLIVSILLTGFFPRSAESDPVSLVTGRDPRFLAVDAERVYWNEGTTTVTLFAVPRSGGLFEELGSVVSAGGQGAAEMEVGPGAVYWAIHWGGGTGRVAETILPNGPTTEQAVEDQAWGIALDDSYVYWSENNGGPAGGRGIRRRTIPFPPMGGGTLTTVGGNLYRALEVDESHAYFSYFRLSDDVPVIARVEKNAMNETPDDLDTTGEIVEGLAVYQGVLYWGNPGTGTLSRMDIDGSNFETIASGLNDPRRLVVADSFIYVAEYAERAVGAGAITRVSLDGSDLQRLYTGLTGPYDIRVKDGIIYWTERGTQGNADGAIKTSAIFPFLAFPLDGYTPYSAPISAAFDHSMPNPGCPNGVVTAYTGEEGRQEHGQSDWSTGATGSCPGDTLFGFPNGPLGERANFLINCHYMTSAASPNDGLDILFYDGHTGYDYPAADGTPVLAAAPGAVIDVVSPPNGTVVLRHDNDYSTHYLHLSAISVILGQEIAVDEEIGSVGMGHLHFTVKRADGVRVDPYGWLPATPDPYLAAGNTVLWRTDQYPLVFADGFETGVPCGWCEECN